MGWMDLYRVDHQFKLSETWGGIAVESHGHAVLAGKKSYTGMLWRLDNPEQRYLTFTARISTFGLALGGGVSVHMIFFINAKSIYKFEGMEMGNGGNFHFDIPVTRLAKLARSLRTIYTLTKNMNEYHELVQSLADLRKTVTTTEPTVLTKEVVDGKVMAGYTRGVQGTIDIRNLTGPGGSTDNL